VRRPRLILGGAGHDPQLAVALLEVLAGAGFDVTERHACARLVAGAAERRGDGPLDVEALEQALELAKLVVVERGRCTVEDSDVSVMRRLEASS
jgi:hypothetical protein